MKATELHFPVVLFIMLYKVVLTFEPAVVLSVVIQMKSISQCFPLMLFIMVFKEVKAFKVVHYNMLQLEPDILSPLSLLHLVSCKSVPPKIHCKRKMKLRQCEFFLTFHYKRKLKIRL